MNKKKIFGPILFIKNLCYLSKYNLKEIYHFLGSSDMLVNQAVLKSNFIKFPTIKNNFETLQKLIETESSFIRFGDGEYFLMDEKDIPFQKYDPKLSNTLKEIIYNDFSNLMIGIPYEHLYPEKEKYNPICDIFVSEFLSKNLDLFSKLTNPNKTYYSSSLSQVYPLYKKYDFEKHFSMLRQIWNNKNVTLVCGNKVLKNVSHNILDNASKVDIIYGPAINAYDEYDNLYNQILNTSKNNLLLFSIGPAGKALAYEFYKKGYRVLDIGHSFSDYDSYKSNIKMNEKEVLEFFKKDL